MRTGTKKSNDFEEGVIGSGITEEDIAKAIAKKKKEDAERKKKALH